MRLLILVVAACGSDAGAVLTVAAPGGPTSAGRIEIVLAGEQATIVDGQRVRPGSLETETVRYYRQRTTAGEVGRVPVLDGFAMRIEANGDDETFAPFMLAYDDAGMLIGVGAVMDQGVPGTIEVLNGELREYVVAMSAAQMVDVRCESRHSGVAWGKTRLLLGEDDATGRDADLDCDGHAADVDDCDDLRAKYHPGGAPDACDGEDTDCGGERLIVVDCPLEPSVCGVTDGVQLCSDAGGNGARLGMCVGDPACLCRIGPCTQCVIAYEAQAAVAAPCAPAIGKLQLRDNGCTAQTPCIVEVVPRHGPWEGKLALGPDGPFGTTLTGVTEAVHLRARYVGGPLPAAPGASVGALFLAITSAGATRHVGIDLAFGTDPIGDCAQVGIGNDLFAMTCTP